MRPAGARPASRREPGYRAFIAHRLSGLALAIFLPLHFLALGLALATAATGQLPPPGYKIAFIGDQGDGANAVAVLQLIHDEGTDAVVHSGDWTRPVPCSIAETVGRARGS